MIKLIFNYIQPNTMIVTDCHHEIIQDCLLEKHAHSVIKAIEEIKTSLKKIERKEETYGSLCLHVFIRLNLTKSSDFGEWVRHGNADNRRRKK
jgi:hypothetical protein